MKSPMLRLACTGSKITSMFATPWVQMNGTVSGQHFATPFVPPTAGSAIDWSFFEPIASSPGVAIGDRLPYTEEYNFTIERQIGSSTVANVAYVGSQGHRLAAAVESNPGIPSVCTFLSNPANLAARSDKCGAGNENDTFTLADGRTVYGTRAPLGINFSEGDQYWVTAGRSDLQLSAGHAAPHRQAVHVAGSLYMGKIHGHRILQRSRARSAAYSVACRDHIGLPDSQHSFHSHTGHGHDLRRTRLQSVQGAIEF